MESLYSHRAFTVLGFHGCDVTLAEEVVLGKKMLRQSDHDYDWLGHGIYFWENDPLRALQWAEDNAKRPGSGIKTPAVLGAYLDLGYCLDLTDSVSLNQLKIAYDSLVQASQKTEMPLPVNIDPVQVKSKDRILRKLDCAVIEVLHELNKRAGLPPYDSVRGVFWEGNELYPGAGFQEKNHIQIAIINPNCIKGFFLPRDVDAKYLIP
ncbi:MAG: hypothetical protein II819_11760 [Fibrobacter sp.]|nr:hypothetical protein [Fibrobacter sp.]